MKPSGLSATSREQLSRLLTFKRGTYDATLNPHKNKQGWPCPGRIGYLK